MSIVDVLLLVAACYRLTELLVNDAGPWGVLAKARERVGASALNCAKQHNEQAYITNVLCCVHCTGIYSAATVYVLWLVAPPLVIVLAVAGLMSLVYRAAD
jgi:hypothetical protein